MKKITKYTIISQEIEKDINENYKPNQQYLSIPTLKSKYSASLDTINKSLSILENKGKIYRIFGKGTFVSENISNKDISILILTPYNMDVLSKYSYLRESMSGINQFVFEKNIKISINSFDILSTNPNICNNYDGIIFLSPREDTTKILNILSKNNYPCVSVTNRFSDKNIINIDTNTPKAMDKIFQILKSKGHKKIGFLNDTANILHYHDNIRMKEYISLGKKYQLETKEDWIIKIDPYYLEKPTLEQIELFSENSGPTAYILSSYEYILPDFLSKFWEIKHPLCNKLSIVGFDAPFWTFMTEYKLTIIKQDFKKLGFEACKMIYKLINGHAGEKKLETIPFELINGESVFEIEN